MQLYRGTRVMTTDVDTLSMAAYSAARRGRQSSKLGRLWYYIAGLSQSLMCQSYSVIIAVGFKTYHIHDTWPLKRWGVALQHTNGIRYAWKAKNNAGTGLNISEKWDAGQLFRSCERFGTSIAVISMGCVWAISVVRYEYSKKHKCCITFINRVGFTLMGVISTIKVLQISAADTNTIILCCDKCSVETCGLTAVVVVRTLFETQF